MEILGALRMAIVTLVLTGLVYPLAMTALLPRLFPRAARGSLLRDAEGRVVGSALIAQAFRSARYVHPRPSAAGAAGYDGTASAGSNLGPTSARLRARFVAEVARLRAENPAAPGPVPAELVTASASGLDPHLSPEAARWQLPRISAARGVPITQLNDLVDQHVEGRTLGVLGEPRINVLRLNLALDARFGP